MRPLLTFLTFAALAAPLFAQTFEQAKPVLQVSCFPCHAPNLSGPPKPAVSLSGEKKRRKMVALALATFPMDEKFPFATGDSPEKQMKEMKYMLSVGKMPPNGHIKAGLGAPLTKADRKALMDWLQAPPK